MLTLLVEGACCGGGTATIDCGGPLGEVVHWRGPSSDNLPVHYCVGIAPVRSVLSRSRYMRP
jgi:hypothetical protein